MQRSFNRMTGVVETIAITGGSGYIGAATITQALSRGYRVLMLGRRRPDDPAVSFVQYDLRDDRELDVVLRDCKAVIHLAADTAAGSRADPALELAAARRLTRAAAKCNARLLYVSSISASPDSRSGYARSKWLVEREVQENGACIVRPGLVYGGTESGLFGDLCRLVRGARIIPIFVPAAQIQPIHVEELARALVEAVSSNWIGVRTLARAKPISFTRFLRIMVRERVRGRRLFVPVPIRPIFALERVIRLVPRAPDIGRLRSLYSTPIAATSRDLEAAQLSVQPITFGMHRGCAGRRRVLLREARTVLMYVLRSKPSSAVVRRYARAVERLDDGKPLVLPDWLHRWPALLAVFGSQSVGPASRLRLRISWATRIAESSIEGVFRFLPPEGRNRPLRALRQIALSGATGLLFLIINRLFAGRLERFACSFDDPP
jgi:nucleoside-diphosphate-sugar epimerase